MRIVAKAASVGDLAERLTRAQQRLTVEQMGGTIKPARIDEFAAGCAALSEELLNIAQRHAGLGGHLNRSKIRIGKTIPDRAPQMRWNNLSEPRARVRGSDGANSAPTRSYTANCM